MSAAWARLDCVSLRATAAHSSASRVPVPTFRSRYCLRSLVLPDLVGDTAAFVAAVTEFVREHSPRVILPTGDVTIGVLREHRQKFAELGCFLALAPEAALDIANDKDRTLMLAEQLGIAQPKSLRIGAVDDLAAAVTGVWLSLRPQADGLVAGRDGGEARSR